MDNNPGWIQVQKDRECETDDVRKDGLKTIEECATACKDISTMFVFDDECYSICGCYCEIGASPNGTCPLKMARFYKLYKYVKGKYSIEY